MSVWWICGLVNLIGKFWWSKYKVVKDSPVSTTTHVIQSNTEPHWPITTHSQYLSPVITKNNHGAIHCCVCVSVSIFTIQQKCWSTLQVLQARVSVTHQGGTPAADTSFNYCIVPRGRTVSGWLWWSSSNNMRFTFLFSFFGEMSQHLILFLVVSCSLKIYSSSGYDDVSLQKKKEISHTRKHDDKPKKSHYTLASALNYFKMTHKHEQVLKRTCCK